MNRWTDLDQGERTDKGDGHAAVTRENAAGQRVKVAVRGVHKSFEESSKSSTVALRDVDLDVRQGEFLALVGPTGCGKSTLLNIVAGLTAPTSGTLTLDDAPITGPSPDRGMLFQDYALFPWRTVKGNIEFGLRFGPRSRRPDKAERDAVVQTYIDLVGLRGSEHKYPRQLSGGMRQRTALARLWATNPEVLLMDEPLAALDAQTRLVMEEELLRIWGQERPWEDRKTIIYVTHAIDEAVFLADRIAVMGAHPGHIETVIDVDLERPRTDAIRADSTYDELHQKVWHLIRDEAYRAARESS